ncbi:ABC transporter substrate-binding protein [Helicobacter sp. MIT 01-3238]|uniref:ABC transporter substrate-binding protein n=1 Tax=Helicobacter sp. MIT 01-3238 TaxID=398627 RepID=UPI0015F1AF6E|nr:ABC transporter substrate-binding protein [Helicobacter sp. MIT 01-3238]
MKSFLKPIIALARASVDRFEGAFGSVIGSGVKILAMFGLALGIFSLCVFFSVSLLRENLSQNIASKSSQNLVASPKVLKIAYSQNVGALNPQGYNKNAMFAQNLLYEGLLKADKNGAIIPSLATSFALDTSGKVYVFSLRKGVRFSNGEEFNADAVVLNFASILKNRARHSWSGLARALERVEKIDDYTVRLVLKEPYAPTLNELALPRPFRFLAPSAFPPDLDLVAQNPEPIGTGAYMLVESKLGSYDKFAKNPHYWDSKRLEAQGGLYYDEVVVKVIFEPNSKLSALRAGQVDMIYGADEIPIRIFQEIRNEELKSAGKINTVRGDSGKSPKFRAYLGQASFATSLMLNSNRIKQAQIRKAIALSIDKDTLINAVYGIGVSGASSGDSGENGVSGKSDKSGGGDCSVDCGANPSDESGASPTTNTIASPIASVAESIFVHTRIVPPSLADDNRTIPPSLSTSGTRGWVETKPKDSPAQPQSRQNANHNPEFKLQNPQNQAPQNKQNQSPTQKGQNQNPPTQANPSQPTQSKQNPTTQNNASQKEQNLYQQNLTKAREILSSFGYTQQNPLKLELFFFGDKPSQKMLAQILQSQLKEANIALSVRGLEPSMYANALRKGEFDMAFVDSWGAPYEPLSQLYSYTKPLGHGDYIAQSALKEKPRIDALILQAIKESASVANSAQKPQNLGQNHGTNPARNSTQNPAINSPQSPAHKSTHTNSAQALSDEAIELLIQSGVYIPLLIERSKAVAHSRIQGVEGVSSLSYEIPIWDFYE